MENIKLGDQVKLKSGGPIMTVRGKIADESVIVDNNITITESIACDWFDRFNRKQTGCFFKEQLEDATETN